MRRHRAACAAAAAVTAWLAVDVPACVASKPAAATAPAVQCPPLVRATGGPSAVAKSAGASVSVSVPRFTFLTDIGGGWVVRTNTEAAPNPRDRFVVIADGHWSPASSTLVNLVVRSCG